VEATPKVMPHFYKGDNGTFIMDVPCVRVGLSTSCKPPLDHEPGLQPPKPYEEFDVPLPEVQRVVFDPRANSPPNGRKWCSARKQGAVVEVSPTVSISAQLKTESPYGSLIIEDIMTQGDHQQKVGETVLNWRLQVEGKLNYANGAGNNGSNRLEVIFEFIFDSYVGGPPVCNPEHQSHPPMGGQQIAVCPPHMGAGMGGGGGMGGPPPMGGPLPMGGMGPPPMGGGGGPPPGYAGGGAPGYGGPGY